ncbi:hypothetical protein BDF19DRAFT_417852 [Syncephalis fuscata]|nr:hypothetical protein BDF19DRAFT_417852 [Syncephalis fuscata]
MTQQNQDPKALAILVNTWADRIAHRREIQLDTITPSQYTLMCMTLDRPISTRKEQLVAAVGTDTNNKLSALSANDFVDVLEPASGTPLPRNWHLAYFPQHLRETELASDGYESNWQPPPPFERRVWASGRMEWWPNNALCVGDRVQRETRCSSVKIKQSNQGTTAFVTIERLIKNANGPTVMDEQCIAYLPTGTASLVKPKHILRNYLTIFNID